jgi:hypothetical protein
MASLGDHLTSEDKKARVIDDCIELLDAEVSDKSGMSGMAIRAGYKAVNGIRPGFVRGVVRDLLPEFASALDPIYQEALSKGEGVAGYVVKNGPRAADALLAITDGKAERAKSGLVKSTYHRLRGMAKKNVEAAMPRLGKLIEKHAS